jgi:opacity protein-like surface antigen
MKHLLQVAVAAGMVATAASPLSAQLLYVGVRGGAGIPHGKFSETQGAIGQVADGAKTGFGYGLDAGVNLGPIGLYAGFDRIEFECDEAACASDSNYKLQGISGGVRLSIPLFPLIKPWVKGGVTYNELAAEYGPTSSLSDFETDRKPGYEIGAGFDIPLAGGFLSLTPQVRYVRQKLDYEAGGQTTSNDVNYYTVDVGLRLRSPI